MLLRQYRAMIFKWEWQLVQVFQAFIAIKIVVNSRGASAQTAATAQSLRKTKELKHVWS